MHAIETYPFLGHPIVLQCFLFLRHFRPLLIITKVFFSLILTVGSYNHTNTHQVNQLQTCVIDYYLIVTPSPACNYPNIDLPIYVLTKTYKHRAYYHLSLLNGYHSRLPPVIMCSGSSKKKISSRPTLSRVNKNTSIWRIKKSHGRSRCYTKYMKKIYIQDHQKLAIKSLLRTS